MNKFNIKFVLNLLSKNEKIGKSDAIEIISFVTKIEYSEVLFSLEKELSRKHFRQIIKISKSVAKGKPLAYILGYKIFRGHKIIVNKNTLIPRMETEQIVDFANDFIKTNNSKMNILDLCSGSGCIGVSVALENDKDINKIVFSDISKKALAVTKLNIIKNQLNNKSEIVKSNFLDALITNKNKFNILLCNPPYIDLNDEDVDSSTLKFEPKIALYAKDEGLFFYKKAITNIDVIMKTEEKMLLVFEIGWKQKNDLEMLLQKELGLKYNWKFEKDYFNNWRYLIIKN
ncbi:N5-glutamine S-adenosyl-L-methionine-dependent methyltransferase [Mesoplasma entomophilum]|uniref:peptide chain release factor N(5)-glutamine methyltransferase n=1 Tax=Mesoplasma entomophilum TaxID=2149 RepID=UPI000CA265A5|nr:peptide chain release factor N(5)-glutamine methyltransferase [Mesoplasma entomophilum]ATZ19782.1 N5-glutamine S-adenosyl-L-methionine-dependent methyltransferase [Mesoplasma entomophilum]